MFGFLDWDHVLDLCQFVCSFRFNYDLSPNVWHSSGGCLIQVLSGSAFQTPDSSIIPKYLHGSGYKFGLCMNHVWPTQMYGCDPNLDVDSGSEWNVCRYSRVMSALNRVLFFLCYRITADGIILSTWHTLSCPLWPPLGSLGADTAMWCPFQATFGSVFRRGVLWLPMRGEEKVGRLLFPSLRELLALRGQ